METVPFTDNKQNPLVGWMEFSKGHRWRRTAEGVRSPADVPDFHAILKKMKAEFARKSSATTAAEPYSTWLVSGTSKPAKEAATAPVSTLLPSPASSVTQDVTEQFNAIVGSNASSWLHSTTMELPTQATTLLNTSNNVSSWLHSSPTGHGGSQDVQPAEVFNTIAGVNVSWLSPLRTKESNVPQQDAAEAFNVIASTSMSWLSSTSKGFEDDPRQDVAKPFNAIADTMSWLASSPATKGLENSPHQDVTQAYNITASASMPWLASSSTKGLEKPNPAEAYNRIAHTSVSSWLCPSVTYISDDDIFVPQSSATVEMFDAIATTDASAWLQSTSSSQHPATVLGPFGAITSSDTSQWLQQSSAGWRNPIDQDYSEWLSYGKMMTAQEGWGTDLYDQWLMPRCKCYN